MSKHGLKRTATLTMTSEGFSIHTFELSYQHTGRAWSHIKEELYRQQEKRNQDEKAWIYDDGHGRHRCTRYSAYGVRITLEHNENDSGYESYFTRMVINPRKLIDPDSSYLGILDPREESVKQIKKAFRKLFQDTVFEEDIDLYKLNRVDFCVNVCCDNGTIFRELIRASQRLPTPPKFKRKLSGNKDAAKARRYDKHYIRFACNSYELVMYDKTYHLTEQGLALSYEKLPEGVLRYEMRVERPIIREWEKGLSAEEPTRLLKQTIKKSALMLPSVFERLFPPAYYLRLPDLKNHVATAPYQEHTRYNMMYLVNAIEETASVDKALGTLRWEDAKKKELLGRFYKLGISPIPLRKNFCADMLPNPTLLLLKLVRDGRVEVKYMRSK